MKNTMITKLGIAVSGIALLAACETTGNPGEMLTAVGGMGKSVRVAETIRNRCFEMPQVSQSSNILGESLAAGRHELEMMEYRNNQQNYEVCSLRGQAQQFAAAAEYSKFALIEIADSVAEIQMAENLRSSDIAEVAQRLKATPAVEIDFAEEANNINAEVIKLQAEKEAMGDIELSPEAALKVKAAEARLGEAQEYVGLSVGTTMYVFHRVGDMSHNERMGLVTQINQLYGNRADEAAIDGLLSDLSSVTVDTARNISGTIVTAQRLADVKTPVDPAEVDEATKNAVTVSKAEASQIVKNIDNGAVL